GEHGPVESAPIHQRRQKGAGTEKPKYLEGLQIHFETGANTTASAVRLDGSEANWIVEWVGGAPAQLETRAIDFDTKIARLHLAQIVRNRRLAPFPPALTKIVEDDRRWMR